MHTVRCDLRKKGDFHPNNNILQNLCMFIKTKKLMRFN